MGSLCLVFVTPGITFVQTVPVCEDGYVDTLSLGGGFRLCTYCTGMETRGIRIFPGVGRKCGKVQISGKSSDKSKSRSWGNQEQTELRKIVVPFGPESSVIPFAL